MNITIKSVPTGVHQRLREVAEQSGRSVNKLILHILERSVEPRRVDHIDMLARIRRRRQGMGIWVDDESLRNAIQEGRR